jgi:hypothetical protein
MQTTINERIRIILKDLFGGNMSAMARITQIPQPSVRNLVVEKSTNPEYDKLHAIIHTCTPSISAHWLLTGEGEMLREVLIEKALPPTPPETGVFVEAIEKLAIDKGRLEAENNHLKTEIERLTQELCTLKNKANFTHHLKKETIVSGSEY